MQDNPKQSNIKLKKNKPCEHDIIKEKMQKIECLKYCDDDYFNQHAPLYQQIQESARNGCKYQDLMLNVTFPKVFAISIFIKE